MVKKFGSLREEAEVIKSKPNPEKQKSMNQKMEKVRVEFLIKTGQMV